MRLPNQRYLARLKRIDRLIIRQLASVFLLALIFLAGCAGGTPASTRFSGLFGGASTTPSPSVAQIPAATPTPTAAPAAGETPEHISKRVAKQARAASENAAAASKEAANASAAAAAYGLKFLYVGLPDTIPYPPVADGAHSADLHLIA